MKFELHPHEGTAGVSFGMTRAQVRAAHGEPIRSDATKDFFAGSALHVHYDSAGLVMSIVVTSLAGGEAWLDGVNLLGVDADAAAALVSRRARVDDSHWEYPTTWTFPDLDLNLWRPCMPEEAEESDELGRKFQAVSIARAGFYAAGA